MGSIHAKNLYDGNVADARLVALCDVDDEKLNFCRVSFPKIRTFDNYKSILLEMVVDAVIVAVPHYFHGEITEYFLRQGISVLCEKPECVSVFEAEQINLVARNSKALFGIMFNQRTNPVYRRAKEIISRGGVGDLRRFSMTVTHWYRSQFYYDQGGWRASWNGEGGGILINQCVHELDILQWLIGMPKSVIANCSTINRNITVENDVTAMFEFENGASGIFVASGHELSGTNRLEIVGDKGKIIIDDFNLTYYKYANSEIEVNASVTEGYGFTDMSIERLSYGGCDRERDEKLGQQIRVIEQFTKAMMEEGEHPVAYGEEGIQSLSIINGIYLSSAKKEKVYFPIDRSEYEKLLSELKLQERKR